MDGCKKHVMNHSSLMKPVEKCVTQNVTIPVNLLQYPMKWQKPAPKQFFIQIHQYRMENMREFWNLAGGDVSSGCCCGRNDDSICWLGSSNPPRITKTVLIA